MNVTSVQNSLVKRKYLETIKAIDGVIYHLTYHQTRLERVLSSQGSLHFHSLMQELIPPTDGIYRCRVVYDSESIDINYFKYEKREIKSLKIVFSDTIDYSYKYEDRSELEKLFAQRESCDDILIVKNSLVTDTTIANIAFFDGTLWVTPKEPLLKGTTRARLLDEGKIVEREIKISDIESFSQVALMNAMIDFDIIASENIRKIFVR